MGLCARRCSDRTAQHGGPPLADCVQIGHPARVPDPPLDALVGQELDTVSFVSDYVELRIGYSIVRLLTDPSGSIGGEAWQLTQHAGADILRQYIGRTVEAVEFDESEHLRLIFNAGATIQAPLRDEDRSGPEALHFMPADAKGEVRTANMWIW